MAPVSVIIPFKASEPYRLKNLRAVIRHLNKDFPDWQIVIGEQDSESKICAEGLPTDTVLLEDKTAFNKSKLINAAFELTTSDVLLIHDADILLEKAVLARTVAAVATELDATRPYHQLIDLDKDQSDLYFEDGTLPALPAEHQGFDRTHVGEHICLAGGSLAVKKSMFEKLGGYNESFIGWGGEDDAFSYQLHSRSNKLAISRQGLAWHLWHPRADVRGSADYHRNCQLLEEIRLSSRQGAQ